MAGKNEIPKFNSIDTPLQKWDKSRRGRVN